MFANSTIEVCGGVVCDSFNFESWNLANCVSELRICDSQRDLLFFFQWVEKSGQAWSDFAFNDSSCFFQSSGSTVELLKFFEFDLRADIFNTSQLLGNIVPLEELFVLCL